MILELIPNRPNNLRQICKSSNISDSLMRDMIIQIFEGFDYLHTHNPIVIHGDVKPDNILYDAEKKRIKICDFGLSQFMEHFGKKGVRGTMNYIAPEIFTGYYNELVDIYSIGMTIVFMATRKVPYSGMGDVDLNQIIQSYIKPNEIQLIENVKIYTLVQHCTDPNTKFRPSCQQVLNNPLYGLIKEPVKFFRFLFLIIF